jgi:hypothetical protein
MSSKQFPHAIASSQSGEQIEILVFRDATAAWRSPRSQQNYYPHYSPLFSPPNKLMLLKEDVNK